MRYEFIQICKPDFFTKAKKAYVGEKRASSTNAAGRTGYLCAEN
jgi:hypothetical protein